jgi:predicted ATPase
VITTFRAKNYGCLVDVTAHVMPLHAFIGPNDSGKSTLLHGMRTVVQFASSNLGRNQQHEWKPFDPFLPLSPLRANGAPVTLETMLAVAVDGGWYVNRAASQNWDEHLGTASAEGPYISSQVRYEYQKSAVLPPDGPVTPLTEAVSRQLRAARLTRFDPDALRASSGLIPETERVDFLDERGRGLAGVYFALRNRNDDTFATIVGDVRKHFPTIKGLRVKAVTNAEVALEAELTSGARVEAARMSEGLLYYLAFAALRHIDPVSLLLVEEPENGLHPARIAEVVKILRAIVEETGTQVIMATHSPLVVNELRPEEVSVVTRSDATGTKVTRIHETPDFAERAKVYALGELWIAYANGDDERPLLTGTEP